MERLQKLSVHDRLVNWARWVRPIPKRARCGSAEGNYIPPRHETQIFSGRKSIDIDPLDAIVVEGAVSSLSDQKAKRYLTSFYVHRFNDRKLMKAFGVSLRELESLHHRALSVMLEALQC